MLSTDGVEVLLPLSDIYTVEHHRVTMMFSAGSLFEREISREVKKLGA